MTCAAWEAAAADADAAVRLVSQDGVPEIVLDLPGGRSIRRPMTRTEQQDLRRWTEMAIPRGQER